MTTGVTRRYLLRRAAPPRRICHPRRLAYTTLRRDIYLFIYFNHAVNQAVIPKEYVTKQREQRKGRAHCRPSAGQLQQKRSVALHCAQVSGAGIPPHKLVLKKRKKRTA